MSDQTPDEPTPPQPSPYGSPPPPPATNPYAAPSTPTPVDPSDPTVAVPPIDPIDPYNTPTQAYPAVTPPPPGYGTPPPPPGYAAPTYAAAGYAPSTSPKGAGGVAITALVLAIIAALLSWIPFICILALLLALVGMILGIVAWAKAGKSHRPKGMAISATIVSVLALLLASVMTVFSFWLGDVINECNDTSFTSAQEETCIEDGILDKFGIDRSA